MIKLIMVECNISLEKEGIIAFMGDNLKEQKLEGSIYNARLTEEGNQFFQSTMSDHSWLEGSSTSSVCLVEPLPVDSSPGFRREQVAGLDRSPGLAHPELLVESLIPTQPEYNHKIRPKKNIVKEKDLNDLRRREGESRKSRNLFTERNRRKKLKTKILTLRSLVPDITRMDIQATLGDAKSYIEKLQTEVKALQDELKDLEDEANKNAELKDQTVADKGKTEDYVTSHFSASDISTDQSKYNQDSLPAYDLAQQMEEKVEVSECGENTFALKLIFERRRGWFLMLMEAMQALGLNITEANAISVKGRVMNIFKAEAKSDGVQTEQLKDSLLKLLHNGLLMDKA
ncbi:hypothetical protein AQUCO_02500344v1 [Aquilegia coerulea]|nr:hypothetical protein AQUCO_02500344v1 [Aquilegia coerulea]PIA40569.1 hypothetical protein AQUCO_02500344v1 [Aquilegia coerulea]